MVDREKVIAVLRKRFEGASAEQIAAAANAIVGLEEEWEEVAGHEPDFGYHFSVQRHLRPGAGDRARIAVPRLHQTPDGFRVIDLHAARRA